MRDESEVQWLKAEEEEDNGDDPLGAGRRERRERAISPQRARLGDILVNDSDGKEHYYDHWHVPVSATEPARDSVFGCEKY